MTSHQLPIKSQLLSLVFRVLHNVVTINLVPLSPVLSNNTNQSSLSPHSPTTDNTVLFFLACLHSSLLLLSCTTVCFQQISPVNLKYLPCYEGFPSTYYQIIWSFLNSETCYLHLKELSMFYTLFYQLLKVKKHRTHIF